ncbi:T9SS type A sorting domain-containing protein [Flavobacterium sp. FlaQc-52]|uniref:T9SS type A sorting domain-containing protein n=1 Tax=Flavobacterium sp. FlaQc-52 TaxID=3374185 RepID=UPI00375688E7
MKIKLFVLLFPILGFGQVQIGGDINGKEIASESGSSVSLSANGRILAIGAPDRVDAAGDYTGVVRVYENKEGVWTQLGDSFYGIDDDENNGTSVSLSGDGSVLAIGAPGNDIKEINAGAVRVYKNNAGVWKQIGNVIYGSDNSWSGTSISLSADGTILAVGAPHDDNVQFASGMVQVYENKGGAWVSLGNPIYGKGRFDLCGQSVSLSADGNTLAIGSSCSSVKGRNSGQVRVFKNKGRVWTQLGGDIDGKGADAQSGYSVSLSANGTILAVGSPYFGAGSGQVQVYKYSGAGFWGQMGPVITEGTSSFGSSISLSNNGNTLAVGAPDLNQVQVYKYNSGTSWGRKGVVNEKTPSDRTGQSVFISSDGSTLAIGSPHYNTTTKELYLVGQVRAFDLSDLKTSKFTYTEGNSELGADDFNLVNLRYYPNPVRGELFISYDRKITSIAVVDLQGQVVVEKFIHSTQGSIDMSNFKPGVYFLNVTVAGKSKNIKIIKE